MNTNGFVTLPGCPFSDITFADGTIRTSTQEPKPDDWAERTIDKTIITSGPGTPLDGLQVDRVEQTSLITKDGDRRPEDTKIDIKYKNGETIDYYGDLQLISSNDGKGNTQLISVYSEFTLVNKPDGSFTWYPKAGDGNAYTVYPRAADGTQKTVTVTSEGQPIVTVRVANDNIIPPKE